MCNNKRSTVIMSSGGGGGILVLTQRHIFLSQRKLLSYGDQVDLGW